MECRLILSRTVILFAGAVVSSRALASPLSFASKSGDGKGLGCGAYIFLACAVGFMGGCVALITYIQRLRSNKIESVARSLALPFRRKPTDQDKALIVGCNLEGTSIQNVSNVVEAARTEELNLTLFDYEYAYVGGSSAKRYQTISRVQSSGLKLPSFMMFPKTMYSKIGGGSSDISFPEAIEFNKKYILRAGDEAGIRAIFTSDLLHFIGQQEHLTIEGFGDLVFVYRAGRRPKPRDFAASIAEAKHILALLLEGQRSRSPTEETAS